MQSRKLVAGAAQSVRASRAIGRLGAARPASVLPLPSASSSRPRALHTTRYLRDAERGQMETVERKVKDAEAAASFRGES